MATDEILRYALAVHRTPGVGPVMYRDLMARFGTARAVLDAAATLQPKGRMTATVLAHLQAPDWAAVDSDLAWGQHPGNAIIEFSDPRYPYLLTQIADPPPILFVRGDTAILSRHQVAVVGSRNPSPAGRDTARVFARELATAGLVITSGLAYGIDGTGHEGALEVEHGSTIAVAATGLDRVYPSQHRALAQRIVERGALVSEYPPGTPPLPIHFPRRNRIISGLSLGVLVVEAAIHSGSLITAHTAAEQNRTVFSIPGSIHNPLARGCHALLRDGAKLVEKSQDILEELAPLLRAATRPCAALEEIAPEADVQKLLACFGYDPLPIDTLIERSGLTPAAVSSMLVTLEIRGFVAAQLNGLYYPRTT